MIAEQLVPEVRISAMQVRALVEGVEQTGTTAQAFLERAHIDTTQLADPQGWFSLASFDAALVDAVRLTGDPAFGLHWGERSPMMQLDLAPALVATASTLRSALECITQLQPLLASRPEMSVETERDPCVVACDPLGTSPLALQTRAEIVVTGIVRLLRYLGAGDAIHAVRFTHARPAHGDEYDRLFGSTVRFEQPAVMIEFARSALDKQHVHRNIELHRILCDRTEQLRKHALAQLSYAEQIEQHIRATLPSLLSMTEAARAMKLSERSLRRRLAEESLSYSELVDRVQRSLAFDLLAAGDKSVKETAHALGFSSVSGFHRAFRRWTGSAPTSLRPPRARG